MQKDHIIHSHARIDRCCKSSGWEKDLLELKPDKRDGIKRLSCDISKKKFMLEYINKRKFAVLQNCTYDWKAKKWTFKSKYMI